MVNQIGVVKNKGKKTKKLIKFFIAIFVFFLVLILVFAAGYLLKKPSEMIEIILENPLAGIVSANTNDAGVVDVEKVIEQAVMEFDEDYINFILVALGTGYLRKSIIGGNPLIEFDLEGEVWSSEIIKGMPNSVLGGTDKEDLRISISKEEAVKGILSENREEFMRDSYLAGRTDFEMVAGKTELFAKGYLDMYNALTGK